MPAENVNKRSRTEMKTGPVTCLNFINNEFVEPSSGKYMPVINPSNEEVIGKVGLSTAADVDAAAKAAEKAAVGWSSITTKSRVQIMMKFFALVRDNEDMLADLIVLEHGKNKAEALGDVRKGNETVEYACSMPQLIRGNVEMVSRGVECKDIREPHGVVASIVPFNFPAMVPMWTMPIALAVGNCVILKPSEKVPLTTNAIMALYKQAGFPPGVVQCVNGTVEPVTAICDHPVIKAVSFVGSSKVAEIVYKRCTSINKACLALGGAKNHLIAAPDCNIEMTAQDVVNSYSGCTGQRCMAASVLITLGEQKELVDLIVAKSAAIVPGQGPRELGPVIDQYSMDRINKYIEETEGKILLDGRGWKAKQGKGFWIGPTVILHTNPNEAAMREEIFGPVISIYVAKTKDEAIAIENGNPYGNAACIYTTSGVTSSWFTSRFSAGMIGVNVGVPVPREPFSFGGWNKSKFGNGDITGDSGIEFFTQRKKVTTKWVIPENADWMS